MRLPGNISDQSRERCVQLFAELGTKIDRIAAYLRMQQRKATIAAEEAQRLQQRRRSAEQRVSDVKEMLTYFIRCRGLKRLEGELNTIRLQTNSQPALQIDDWELPQEFCLHTGSISHRLLKEMLEHLPDGPRGEFLQAMINTEPNPRMVRDALKNSPGIDTHPTRLPATRGGIPRLLRIFRTIGSVPTCGVPVLYPVLGACRFRASIIKEAPSGRRRSRVPGFASAQ